jgi:hypothetical protein
MEQRVCWAEVCGEWEESTQRHKSGTFETSALIEIERHLPASIEASAETGCGKSTIMFSNLSEKHLVFSMDDRDDPNSSVTFYETCPLTRLDRVRAHFGPTQLTLPTFQHEGQYDAVLIDGPHGFPFPEMEYLAFYPHIREGGVLIVDDLRIPTIGRLADFIAEDDMFDLVAVVACNTAVFRRTSAPTFNPHGDGWWLQSYNKRRVSPKQAMYLDDGPVVDAISSRQLDRLVCR